MCFCVSLYIRQQAKRLVRFLLNFVWTCLITISLYTLFFDCQGLHVISYVLRLFLLEIDFHVLWLTFYQILFFMCFI